MGKILVTIWTGVDHSKKYELLCRRIQFAINIFPSRSVLRWSHPRTEAWYTDGWHSVCTAYFTFLLSERLQHVLSRDGRKFGKSIFFMSTGERLLQIISRHRKKHNLCLDKICKRDCPVLIESIDFPVVQLSRCSSFSPKIGIFSYFHRTSPAQKKYTYFSVLSYVKWTDEIHKVCNIESPGSGTPLLQVELPVPTKTGPSFAENAMLDLC